MNYVSTTLYARSDHIVVYSQDQYSRLVTATISTSSISLISSLCTTTAFMYLKTKYPERSNRVSLRCVFLASLMNLIYTVFNVAMMLTFGDTLFCKTASIVNLFAQVVSSALLALVSINLVLTFVLDVNAERFYYPSAVLYGLIAVSRPLSEVADDGFATENYDCYYFVFYYQLLGHTSLYWMWYYAFILLSIVIATTCSMIGLFKLVHEHHNLIRTFTHIASTSETLLTVDFNIQYRLQYQSRIFTKVVIRCILYPLVPLMTHIWGFVFQLILVQPNINSKYALSMMNTIFTSLQGFFIALIFFSDPAVSHLIIDLLSYINDRHISQQL